MNRLLHTPGLVADRAPLFEGAVGRLPAGRVPGTPIPFISTGEAPKIAPLAPSLAGWLASLAPGHGVAIDRSLARTLGIAARAVLLRKPVVHEIRGMAGRSAPQAERAFDMLTGRSDGVLEFDARPSLVALRWTDGGAQCDALLNLPGPACPARLLVELPPAAGGAPPLRIALVPGPADAAFEQLIWLGRMLRMLREPAAHRALYRRRLPTVRGAAVPKVVAAAAVDLALEDTRSDAVLGALRSIAALLVTSDAEASAKPALALQAAARREHATA